MHERGNLSCKVLSVMMRLLNSLNCFSFGNEYLWTITIHCLAGTSLTVLNRNVLRLMASLATTHSSYT